MTMPARLYLVVSLSIACAGAASLWQKEAGARVAAGNVPFVYPLTGGAYRLYFCGQGGILSAISPDGLQFAIEPGVRVRAGCDPSLLLLDDGRYRLYYKIPFGPGGPGQSIHKAYSAISPDGVNFIEEGLRLESEGTIDRGWVSVPEVVRTFDGRWRMYYVSARDGIANVIASAISEDGLRFEREEGIRVSGMVDPAVVKLPNGQYWLSGMVGLGSMGGPLVIRSATSADGLRFEMDEGVLVESGGVDDARGVFDPSVVPLPNGRFRMYYGGDASKTLSAVGERVANQRFGAGAVVSAADGRLAAVAPGSLATLYGTRLTTNPALTGVSVNGVSGTVLFASETQINFNVPPGLTYETAHVVVTSPDGRQTTALAPLRRVAPRLFTLDASGVGEAAALDALRFTPGPFRLGPSGVYVALFATGARNAATVTVRVNGVPVAVRYAGPQGQFEGLDQINVWIPPDFPATGVLPVRITADGEQSAEGVTLRIERTQ